MWDAQPAHGDARRAQEAGVLIALLSHPNAPYNVLHVRVGTNPYVLCCAIQVGYKSVDDHVTSGMVVGLGTGSTAYFAGT
jgi:hypothetical protein